MKTKFFENYELSGDKIKDIWQNALVVFDTNILLNLYRYNKETCDDILQYMETLGDRLWMPYQVGWEYNNNRVEVAYKSQIACDVLCEQLDSDRIKLDEFFKQNFRHHPYLQHKEFFKRYDRYIKLLKAYLDEQKENENGYFDNDTILEKLGELYENRVGEDYTSEQYKTLFVEGKRRYEEKIPPGYKDNTKEKQAAGNKHLYGDYIVWEQVIQKAADADKDIIFVSDDLKEDWIFEFKGKKYGPRKELIKEFHDKTNNHNILIYSQEKFLNYANEQLNAAIKKETIDEVQTVNQDIVEYYRTQIAPNVIQSPLTVSGIEAMIQSLPQVTPLDMSQLGLTSALESYRSFSDYLQEQAEKIKAITEPFEEVTRRVNRLSSIGGRLNLATAPGWNPDNRTGLWMPQQKKKNADDDTLISDKPETE